MSDITEDEQAGTRKADGGSNVFLQSGLSLRLLAGDTLFYGAVAGLSRVSTLILIPFFTRALAVSEFGILDTLWTMTNVGLLLGNAGVDLAMTYYFHHVPREEHRTYLTTGLCLRAGFGILVACAGLGTSAIVSGLVFNSQEFGTWTALSYLVVPFTLVVTYSLDLLRNEHRRRWFLVLSLVRVVLLLSGTWWLVAVRPGDLVGAFLLLRALPEALTAAVLLFLLRDRWGPRWFNRTAARRLLSYGLPLVPATLLLWLLGFVDRWFLYHWGMTDAAGVYALAVKVGMLLTIFAAAVQMAFNPFSLAVRDQGDAASFYARSFSLTMLVALALVLILGANMDWLIRVAGGDRYGEAAMPASFLLVGNLAVVAAVFFATGANVERKTGVYVYATGSALVITVTACSVMIPVWGPTGAAIAVASGNIVLAAVMLGLAGRARPIPYRLLPVLTAALLCAGITISMSAGSGVGGGSPVVKNGIAVAGILIMATCILTADEKARVVLGLGLSRKR